MANEDLEDFLIQHRLLRQSLPATWNAFFARFGTLRPVQMAAMPRIVAGDNVLVTAPTAGGKTEAVAAPICERLLRESWPGLSVITVTPTRALVNDLFFRLQNPTREIGIRLGRKTADHAISAGLSEQFLITTPESLESLLTFKREALTNLRALIVDEIHLLDGSPRGDQLRWLIRRLSAFLSHIRKQDGGLYQRIALSATVSDPERLAAAYLGESASVIRVSGQRDIEGKILCVPGKDEARAEAAIEAIAETDDVRKVLVFVNSRKQVDVGATHFQHGAFAKLPVYGHHGSLSKHQREQVEEQFRNDHRAICVATMTLEVGIDIGDVDLVVCVDPPFSLSSFLQRIGRGCRRLNGKTRVLCIARDRVSQLVFEAYVEQSRAGIPPGPTAPMRRSVLVQQVLAYLKQVGKHRRVASQFLNIFTSDCPPKVPPLLVEDVLADMEARNLLNQRNGVFMPAQDGWEFIESSRIYSNIAPSPDQVVLVDADTGQHIASVRAFEDQGVRIAGRSFDVLPGSSRSRRVVRSGGQHDEAPKYQSRMLPFAFDVGASLSRYLGIPKGQLIALRLSGRITVLTWLGRLFNSALGASLRRLGNETEVSSFALHFSNVDTETVLSALQHSVVALSDGSVTHDFKPDTLVDMGPHLKYLSAGGTQKARRDWLDTGFLEDWVQNLTEIVIVDSEDARFEDFVALAATK